MTRRMLLVRLCMLTLGLISLMSFASNTASAQIKCACDVLTIEVRKDVKCDIPYCIKYTDGTFLCNTAAPGVPSFEKCKDGMIFLIKDCTGNLVEVTQKCVNIGISPGCCVQACLVYNPKTGCASIVITPAPVDCKC